MSSYTTQVIRLVNDDPGPHRYDLRRSAWLRAMALMNRLGSERALDAADARADRAFARGDLVMCRRWRDMIVAIHAVEEDELKAGERIH